MVKGFAVRSDAGILIDTVFPTERGAKVNWLYTHAQIPMSNGATDLMINNAFDRLSDVRGVKLVPVEITEAQ